MMGVMKRWLIACCLLGLWAVPHPAAAQQNRDPLQGLPQALQPVSQFWIGFGVPGAGLALEGDRLYLAPGEGDFCVYDVSHPQRLHVLGHLGVGFVAGVVKLAPQRLLIGPRGRDAILDVSDPAHIKRIPLEMDFSGLPLGGKEVGDIRGFVVLGPRRMLALCPYSRHAVFAMERGEKLWQWRCVGQLVLPPERRLISAWLDGRDLFLLTLDARRRPQGMMVARMRAWPDFGPLQTVAEPDAERVIAQAVRVGDRRLVVRRVPRKPPAKRQNRVRLELWDVSRPARPRRLSEVVIQGYPVLRDMKPFGDRLFVTLAYQPGSQDEVSLISETGRVQFRATSALAELSLTDDRLQVVSMFHSPGLSRYGRLAVSEQAVFISDYNFGVWRLQRTAQGWQVQAGAPAPAEGHFVTVQDRVAFVTTTFASLVQAVDVREPRRPRLLGWFWNQQWILNPPASAPGALYLPMRYGVRIVDVRNPKQMRAVRLLPWKHADARAGENPRLGDSDFRVWSDGRRAIVAARRTVRFGLQHVVLVGFDLSDPLSPRRLWTIEPDRNVTPFTPTICVEGDRLYLNNAGGRTLEIYQLQQQGPPKHLASFSTEKLALSRFFNVSYPGHFAVRRGVVYLLNGGEIKAKEPIFHVVDARDPRAVRWVRSVFWPRDSYFVDMAVRGDRLFLQDYWSPIAVYDLSFQEGLAPVLCARARATWAGWSLGESRGPWWYVPGLSHLAIYRVTP